ncbi:MAG: ABC transporter substrate-binding protein [Acidobacteriota bacterium]
MLLAALLPISLLVGACQPREPSPVFPNQARGGELRVLLPGEPRGFDPNAGGDEVFLILAPNLYNPLIALDVDGRLLPDLAKSWEVSDGGRTYIFHLREGVVWHDGKPFRSDDVRFTYERLKAHPSLAEEAFRRIERIETPDDLTVVVRLTEPWAPFLPTLAWNGTYILPKHIPPGGPPVGTGPFRFGGQVRGRRVVLVANPRFHRPGPFLDRVIYRPVADSARAADAIVRGEADTTITRVPYDRLFRLQRTPGVRVVTSPSSSRFYCAFNLTRPPLGDRRVREAINRALDRGEIVRRALFGYGAPGLGFYTPSVGWAYNGEAHVPPFDPERARSLIREAGARPVELLIIRLSPMTEMADLIREELGRVGLPVRIAEVPVSEWLDRIVRRRDYDMTIIAGMQGPDPENLRMRFGSGSVGGGGVPGYSSPELDAAVAAGAASVDLRERAQAYYRAQAVLARDLPIAPLAEAVHTTVFRANVRGLAHAEGRGLVPANDYSLVRVRP